MKFSIISLFLATSLVASTTAEVLMCYYGTWAHYRPAGGKVSIQHLDPNLCTHIIYTFVGINDKGDVTILDGWLDIDLKGFEQFVNLKQINPNVKLLLAIGGWNQRSDNFSKVMASPELRAKFIQNVLSFVKTHNFDGFDLDWEYPGDPDQGGIAGDKETFIELLKELRKEFDTENLLLTAAVGSTQSHREKSYHVAEMSKYLHYINVMSYDLHGKWEQQTGHNAPLYGHPIDTKRDLNVDTIIQDWIKEGADPKKLVLGLGFYGRSFTLASASNNVIGAPTIGGGVAGRYTRESGSLSYQEICYNLKYEGWNYVWSEEQQVPYAYKGDQWVGFDDVRSLNLKVDLVKKYNLGGVMLWSIEQDDIPNDCGEGHYPLLTAINKRLGLSFSTTPPPPRPSTTTTTPRPDGEPNTSGGDCSADGSFADPNSCEFFYQCYGGNKINLQCGAGTLFDASIGMCNHAGLVKC